ncbi:hypothetical protein TNCV_1267821 [Trichonephila clavipes]|nr:hypothetical protein TNCV_1267821 [Trichonephila clavipes]
MPLDVNLGVKQWKWNTADFDLSGADGTSLPTVNLIQFVFHPCLHSGVTAASTLPWVLVAPAIQHLQRNLLNCKKKKLSPRETILVMKPKLFLKKETWPHLTSVVDSKHQPSTPITSQNLK